MIKRLLMSAIICLAVCAQVHASDLDALVFPLTGEVQLRNSSLFTVPFVFYSIKSNSNTSGALNNTSPPWLSISDYYDVSGNGYIDPSNNWSKLSATTIRLEEGVFLGAGGSLASSRGVSLGTIWNPNVVPYTDLVFQVVQPDSQNVTIHVAQALAGDYFTDGIVDDLDYVLWRQTFGSNSILFADGDLNGVVDSSDYTIWRANFGNVLPPPGGGSGAGMELDTGGVIPEPGTVALLVIGGGLALTATGRAPRSARRAALRPSARP